MCLCHPQILQTQCSANVDRSSGCEKHRTECVGIPVRHYIVNGIYLLIFKYRSSASDRSAQFNNTCTTKSLSLCFTEKCLCKWIGTLCHNLRMIFFFWSNRMIFASKRNALIYHQLQIRIFSLQYFETECSKFTWCIMLHHCCDQTWPRIEIHIFSVNVNFNLSHKIICNSNVVFRQFWNHLQLEILQTQVNDKWRRCRLGIVV